MLEISSVESLLNQAEEREKEYDWLGATKLYEKALGSASEKDSFRRGDTYERMGHALYRAAMQSEDAVFRERMHEAIASYEKAEKSYEGSNEPVKKARELRCKSMNAYMNYWLASDASEKRTLLEKCWGLAKDSLRAFKEAHDGCEYGKTCNRLLSSVILKFTFESNFQARVKMMKEALEFGDEAIALLSTCEDKLELARAFAENVVCLGVFGYYCQEMDEREPHLQKAMSRWQKAKEISEETAVIESLWPVFGCQPLFGLEGTEKALAHYTNALVYAEKTKDNFLVGCALDWLTYHSVWKGIGTEDRDEAIRLRETAFKYADDTRRQFSKISFTSPRADVAWVEAVGLDDCLWLAGFETDPAKRRELLEKAVKAASEVLKRAEDSGYPEVTIYVHGVFSSVLTRLAETEADNEKKKALLEKALEQRAADMTERVTPFLYWNRGITQSTLAQDRSSLADLQKDQETKKSMLQEAVQGKERAVELLIKELNYMEMKIPTPSALYATVGNTQIQHGSLLARLYVLTRDAELLRKAIAAFEDAARWLERLNQRSRMAEAYWKVARTYDDLGEYLQASQNFDFASDNYGKAMHNIPQLKDFYRDHSLYMKAWSEIERARYHHARQEFVSAKERFEKAADLHKTLKQWSYLAPNYSAWATVESAEDLSRREQSEESLGAFEQAAKLFCETKRSLQAQLDKIDNEDEKQMASNMIEATDMRQEYCNSRIAIEEARILDKKGDHDSSSEKYGLAAKTLEKIVQRLESQQERREFEFILNISRAWQKMTRAEAEASPELFVEASRLFEEAKEFAPNEKAIMLALGHSRFCRALDAGTRFADTRDRTLHVAAEKYLESAANYYVKAGYQSASEYAKATELLFDAYVRMDSAKEESDPEKKAKFYAMAEKVLQTSAGYFMKAEHPEKRKQVLGLLEKVKEERELATSLTEMLHSPSIISTTTAFATPTPTHEEAVGSDRFEHADVQANVITRQKELKVDERLDVEIELVNAGKSPALLIKVAEVVPQDFELIEKPGNYRVEDSYLNMKGKRLDALKTEELKIVLKPKAQGVFQLKPKILYIDENGKYKSHEPEPISITVKELGIKGWLKGAR